MGTAVPPCWACRPPATGRGTVQESLPPEKKGGVFRVVSATTCFAVPPLGVGRGACSRAAFHLTHSLSAPTEYTHGLIALGYYIAIFFY